MSEQDLYRVLQVDPEAEDEVIEAAYRRLARKYHPDVMPGPEAAARMVAFNVAWEVLGDADRRRAYDIQRLERLRNGTAFSASTTGPAWAASATPAAPGWSNGAAQPAAAPSPPTAEPTWRQRQPGGGANGGSQTQPLDFGRYVGLTIAQIARTDIEYLEWLERMPIGRGHWAEIDRVLRQIGRRAADAPAPGASAGPGNRFGGR